MAVEETGFGNVNDKIIKNEFASKRVLEAIRPMKMVGILKEEPGLWEVGVPVGVIAAIVPSTNPTSTVCYKAMIALKSGNAIIFSPHPKALACTLRASRIVAEAAEKAGAPKGAVSCLTIPSLEGCRELMGADPVKLILATGGPAMVKAAYSSGKPAIGVGAGNGPAYLHPSCDIKEALEKIMASKTFDNGTVCASEQSIIVEAPMEAKVKELAAAMGYYFMNEQEAKALGAILFRPNGALNPEIVGKSAGVLAEKAGFCVPQSTKILVAREQDAGAKYPYSHEKLCPVLAWFVVENEEAAKKLAIKVLSHEGVGHTFSIHAKDKEAVRRFCREIPVSRFLVNSPAAQGGIGAVTPLFPALTLGCGAVGGSSSSENISPKELVNIRKVVWGRNQQDDLVEILTMKILERLK
jgi:acetaldehyde dehydrogenase (acetylating)